MIEKWLIEFAAFCFVFMFICAGILNDILQIGKDQVKKSDENGEDE